MASGAQAMPDQQGQGGAPSAGGGSQGAGTPPAAGGAQGAPSQAPANPLQMLLARWFQTAKQMAADYPRLAPGAEKIAQGIQEMQTAMVSPPQPTPMGQQPQY